MAGTLLLIVDKPDQTVNYQNIIDKFYPADTRLRDIYIHHCRQVADKALAISHRLKLPHDDDEVETAAMLHDIGIFLTDAPGIDCHGKEPYICHGYLGAKLLREEGVDDKFADVAERHTGAGITDNDIITLGLPIPRGDYMPRTLLERLICYADKFYSKSGDMKEKTLERVEQSMARHSDETLARFHTLHEEFS